MQSVNDIGFDRAKYVRKEAIKLFIIGPLNSAFILFLIYLSMSKNIIFFYAIGLPFTLLIMAILFIYAPLLMIKRHNNTIQEICISKDEIKFETFSALWFKSQTCIIPFSEINIKHFDFPWYGKGKPDKKEGVIITITGHKSLYLVRDYFDDYDEILRPIQLN